MTASTNKQINRIYSGKGRFLMNNVHKRQETNICHQVFSIYEVSVNLIRNQNPKIDPTKIRVSLH